MLFEASLFWALLLPTAAFFVLSPPGWVKARAASLVVTSAIALFCVVGLPVRILAIVAGVVVWTYVGLRVTRGLAQRLPSAAALLVFAPILLGWVFGKQSVALGYEPLQVFYFVGFSFVLVKAWTLIKDVHDGRAERPDPLLLGAFFLYLPTYIAGPMHRIDEFEKSIRAPLPIDGATVVDGLFRFLLGLVKVKVVAALFTPISLVMLVGETVPQSLSTLVGASFAYSIVIWADFSGYSDMAIAAARLMGIAVPENFARPYFAPNIREFWQRWHISFSRVLTSYVFVPVSRALGRRMGTRRTPVMIVATMVTFLICGYWHGPTANFLVWGAYHGAALVLFDLYRSRRTPSLARPVHGTRWSGRLTHALAVAATFTLVSLGWIFFVLPLSHLRELR